MRYLIAKKFDGHGCIAVKSEYGEALASLVDYLGRRTAGAGVQVLTVSSKEAYNEYAPYHEVDTEKAFINSVLDMT